MTDIRTQLRAMPSSLNDACRTMDAAADQIDALVKALEHIALLTDERGEIGSCARAALSRVKATEQPHD